MSFYRTANPRSFRNSFYRGQQSLKSFKEQILAYSPALYLSFDSATLVDESGNGYDFSQGGTTNPFINSGVKPITFSNGGVTFQNKGGAFYDAPILSGDDTSILAVIDFTLNVSETRCVAAWYDDPADSGVLFYINSGKCFFGGRAQTNNFINSGGSLPLNDGKKHLITCVKTSTKWQLWVDGALSGENTDTYGTLLNNEPYVLGNASTFDIWADSSDINLKEFALYDRALSSSEIGRLYSLLGSVV